MSTAQEQARINRECKAALKRGEVTPNGVSYSWGLQNINGAWFILFREKHHTDEDIKRAKRHIYNSRDVVSLTIKQVI